MGAHGERLVTGRSGAAHAAPDHGDGSAALAGAAAAVVGVAAVTADDAEEALLPHVGTQFRQREHVVHHELFALLVGPQIRPMKPLNWRPCLIETRPIKSQSIRLTYRHVATDHTGIGAEKTPGRAHRALIDF